MPEDTCLLGVQNDTGSRLLPELLSYQNMSMEEQGILRVRGLLLLTISGLPCQQRFLCEGSRHRLDHYE